jgi:hypothetical protein
MLENPTSNLPFPSLQKNSLSKYKKKIIISSGESSDREIENIFSRLQFFIALENQNKPQISEPELKSIFKRIFQISLLSIKLEPKHLNILFSLLSTITFSNQITQRLFSLIAQLSMNNPSLLNHIEPSFIIPLFMFLQKLLPGLTFGSILRICSDSPSIKKILIEDNLFEKSLNILQN